MPNATLGATTFTGKPGVHTTRTAPKKVTAKPHKVGVAHEGEDGTITALYGNSGLARMDFDLEWENVGPVTRDAVLNVFGTVGTFNYTDENATVWPVQTLFEDYDEEHVDSIPQASGPMKLYNITLTLRG